MGNCRETATRQNFLLWGKRRLYWDQVTSRSCFVFLDFQKQLWCVLISVAAGQWAGLHITDISLLGHTVSLMCASVHACVWWWMSGGSHGAHGGGAENFKSLSSGWLLWALLHVSHTLTTHSVGFSGHLFELLVTPLKKQQCILSGWAFYMYYVLLCMCCTYFTQYSNFFKGSFLK